MVKQKAVREYGWVKWVVWGVLALILGGLGIREWRTSQIVGHAQYRFNLAMIVPDQGVTFASFDPSERTILVLPFPTSLAIQSRASGEYSITSLYKLGIYKGEGGKFVRQKIQGFMRVPIPGYLVVDQQKKLKPKLALQSGLIQVIVGWKKSDTSLSRFDAIVLLSQVAKYNWREVTEEELVRSAVIEPTLTNKDNKTYKYHAERLQQFVGTRFFDWGLGEAGISVAVVNASGENGLGSDMADFLTNMGFDVVMVRSVAGEEHLQMSKWEIVNDPKLADLKDLFVSLFGLPKPTIGVSAEYRAQLVLWVGEDAKDLF